MDVLAEPNMCLDDAEIEKKFLWKFYITENNRLLVQHNTYL